MRVQGEGAGSVTDEANDNDGQHVVHIGSSCYVLRESLDRMHASKKLNHNVETSDQDADSFLIIHLMNGTTHEGNIPIGADSICSTF